MPDRECSVCGEMFTPRRKVDKTCCLDCQIQWRRYLNREKAKRHYKPRPPRPDAECEMCKARIPAPRSGRMPRFCPDCRLIRQATVHRERQVGAKRQCYKCQVPVPEAAGKPGMAVCGNCRFEPRRDRRAYERMRSLRKYGLTQEQYDQLLASQGDRCAACGTDEPGAKGWCIDHCHKGGHVRALLCSRCNVVAGWVNEDPAVLRALADWLERQTAQVG